MGPDLKELQQEKDHDLIIRLSADLRNGFENVSISLKRLEDGSYAQLTDHELRLKNIEERALVIGLGTIRDDFESKAKGWDSFMDKMKIYLTIAAFGGALLVYIMQQFISGYITLFFR